MSSYYSIIRYVNNQWSNENIAVGLMVLSNHHAFFKVSERKLKFVQKLNPASFKLFDFSINQLKKFVDKERNYLVQTYQESFLKKESLINTTLLS